MVKVLIVVELIAQCSLMDKRKISGDTTYDRVFKKNLHLLSIH